MTTLIKKGQSGSAAPTVPLSFLLVDSQTGQTGMDGLAGTLTGTVSLPDTTTFVPSSGMFVGTQNGLYDYFPSATEDAGPGILKLHVTAPGAQTVDVQAQIVGFDPASDLGAAALASLQTSVAADSPAAVAAAMLGVAFITIPANHTTSGTAETLTYKQYSAIALAVPASDWATTVPAPNATAATSYYLAGQDASAASLVYVSTVSYNAQGIETGRTLKIASPFPSVS